MRCSPTRSTSSADGSSRWPPPPDPSGRCCRRSPSPTAARRGWVRSRTWAQRSEEASDVVGRLDAERARPRPDEEDDGHYEEADAGPEGDREPGGAGELLGSVEQSPDHEDHAVDAEQGADHVA